MIIWNAVDWMILVGLLVCVVVWPTQLITDRQNRWLRIVVVGLCAFQLGVDGPRAQLLPAYLVAAVFLVRLIPRRSTLPATPSKEGIGKKIVRFSVIVGTGFVLLVSILLCLIFPRFEYPAPTGKYALGMDEIRLIDSSRLEFYTAAPNDHREVTVRVTYPAEAGSESEGLPRGTAHSDAAEMLTLLLPNSITLSWGAIPTHAKVHARVATAQAKYPVLIFSHGFPTGTPEQNTVLVEELASHGYIVMAINHSWQSFYYQLADGTMANLRGLTKLERELGPPQTDAQKSEQNTLWKQVLDQKNATVAAQTDLMRRVIAADSRAQKFNALTHSLVSDDQRFVMGSLNTLQTSDPLLAGHLDIERIGVFGHSAGGTASQITCALDRRCRAGINLDGFQPLLLDLPPLATPFMLMNNSQNYHRLVPHEQSKAASYVVRVKGASHLDFMDAMLSMSILKRWGLLGSIETQRMYQLTNEYVLAFFDQHLLEQQQPLLEGPSDRYPEVTFLSRRP